MKQFIFYVDGLRDGADESTVVQAAESIFGHSDIKVNTMASSLTVSVSKDDDIDTAIEQLRVMLQELGYTLRLPPSCVDLTEIHSIDTPLDARRPNGKHRIPLSAFVATVCAVLIVAVLGAYTVATTHFNQKLTDIQQEIWEEQDSGGTGTDEGPLPLLSFPELEIFKFLFDQYGLEDVDDEVLLEALLKAYADNSGDPYAEYYNAEELEALEIENQGAMEGVGISITNGLVEIDGQKHPVMTVINVFNDSPALAAGLRVGDHIYTVTDANETVFTVEELGYDSALACVRGVSGTKAEFSVIRFSEQSTEPEIISFSITRASVTAETVTSRVLSPDSKIAIVKISQFDLTTPAQFRRNMDALIDQGCTKFIFDVRYNPGGLIPSVKAVLSTLLQKDDVMLSMVYKDGTQRTDYVEVIPPSEDVYDECTVSEQDIGKYSSYDFVVLTNRYTASSAELFAANIRDHELGTLIGETTYGKGCVQRTYNLDYFGIEGALKLTIAWYAPPCGENYHGVGITPDVAVETDKALIEQYGSIYLVPDEQDPQIRAAIEALNQ